jgi:hypothetical protein
MIRTMSQLFESGSETEILDALHVSLKNSNESPFWTEKTIPFAQAILSVLIPLREQHLLFSPEGTPESTLSATLFLKWCDLYSLRALAFILQKSNTAEILRSTQYDIASCEKYEPINLEVLGSYLSSYMVDLENEMADFPITHYNLHIGIADLIKKLLV